MKYYTVLLDNWNIVGKKFDWTEYLPKNGYPGNWSPPMKSIMYRGNYTGYYYMKARHITNFCFGNQLFEVEPASTGLYARDEHYIYVAQSIRLIRQIDTWNDKILRLFACWLARKAWDRLVDERSKNAIEIAEKYADGKATQEELVSARDLAWATVRDQRTKCSDKLPAYMAAFTTESKAYSAIDSMFTYCGTHRLMAEKLVEMLGLNWDKEDWE